MPEFIEVSHAIRAGVPVCEHMTNLAAVPNRGGRLHAVPIAWSGGTSFPVRAYVVVGSVKHRGGPLQYE